MDTDEIGINPNFDSISCDSSNRDNDVNPVDDSSGSDSETFDNLAQELLQAEISEQTEPEHNQVTDALAASHVGRINDDDPSDALTVESLMRMTPMFQGRDTVKIATRHLLLTKLKSQPSVRRFFPQHRTDAFERLVRNDWFDFETYAVLYVCQTLSRCNDPYNLSRLVDKQKVDKHMKEISECPEWKKVGEYLL